MTNFLNTLAEHWYTWQFAMLWQMAVLIGVIWIIDLLIRKWAHPQVRYALWMLILVKLLIPPTWTSPASITSHIPATANRAATVMERADTTEAAIGMERIDAAGQATDETVPPLSPKAYAMFIWLAGMAALSLWLIARLTGLRREHLICHSDGWHGQAPLGRGLPERFYIQLEAVAKKLRLKRLPRVVLTDKVACPAVFGIFRPVLLMPAAKFKNMSRQDTEHILLHELAHIKRGDLLIHAVYMILQIAYWFNPLLWMARRPLQNLRELCCDATVAKLLKEKTVHYRQTLLDTARQLLAEPVDPGLGLLGLFENSNWLITRLKWLEKNTWKNRPLRIATIILLVSVMATCVLPMGNRKKPEAGRQKTEAASQNQPNVELKYLLWQPLEGESKAATDHTYWTPSGKVLDSNSLPEMLRMPQAFASIAYPSEYNSRPLRLWFANDYQGIDAMGLSVHIANMPTSLSQAETRDAKAPNGVSMVAIATDADQSIPALADLYISYAIGNWETIVEFDTEKGEVKERLIEEGINWSYKNSQDGLKISLLFDKEPDHDKIEYRQIVVGCEDKKHSYTVERMGRGGVIKTVAYHDLKSSDLRKVKIQKRPRTSKVIKDISLRPEEPTQNSELKTNNSQFTATLPNGVTVELVGVCEHPIEGKQWWRPDGSSLSELPFDYSGGRVYSRDNEQAYDFAIRYTNIPEDMDSIFHAEPPSSHTGGTLHSSVQKDGKDLHQYQNGKLISTVSHLATVFDKNRKICAIKMGISDGPWETNFESIRSKTGGKWGTSSQGRIEGGAVFGKPMEEDRKTWLPVTHTMDCKVYDVRVIAVHQDGSLLKPIRTQGGSTTGATQLTLCFDMPLEYITEFRVQTRKYEWVTFKNISLRPGGKTEVEIETEKSEVSSQKAEADKFVFGPVQKEFLHWVADGKSTIDFDTETVHFGTGTETMEEFNDWLSTSGIDAISMDTGIHGLCGFDMVVVPVEQDMWSTSPERAMQFLSVGKPGTPANISGKGKLPVTYLFKTREGAMGILQIVGFKKDPDGGVNIRYKMIQKNISLRPGGETGVKIETQSSVPSPQSSGGKTKPQSESAELGPVDFEGYFEDSASGGQAIEQLWNDRNKDLRDADEILNTVRGGLHRYRGSGNILRWIGNLFIWGKNPQNEKAIELMYHASGSPDRGLYGDAIYFGLSVTKNKTPQILRAMAAVAMKTDDYYNVTGRILWGCRNQKNELIACLDPYLNSDDTSIRQKAQDVKAYFTDSKAFMAKRAKEHEESVQQEYGDKLEGFKDELLKGNSQTRLDTLKQLQGKGIMSIVDASFLDAFQACTKDSDPKVRAKAARIMGGKFVWKGGTQNQQAIDILTELLNDSDHSTRYAAVYYGLSTVRNPGKELVRKMLVTILDDREINYYGRVIWGIRRNKQACVEILTEWMNQSEQDNQKAIKAYEIYEDVVGEPLPEEIALRFAGQKSDTHEGLVAMCFQAGPVSKEELQKQFFEHLTNSNLIQKVSDFYIIENRQTAVGMFICNNLSDRNAIRSALAKDGLFQVAGYMHGQIGPTGSGWIGSLSNFRKQNEPNRVPLPTPGDKTEVEIENQSSVFSPPASGAKPETREGKLEFRIVANLTTEQAEEVSWPQSDLAGHKWIPIKNKENDDQQWPWYTDLPFRIIENTIYLLVSNEVNETMLADGSWGLQKVYPKKDTRGRSVVGFDFDNKGAALFYNLTNNHIGKRLAIIIDGVAYSAPQINSAIRGHGLITGHFDEAEVAKLVDMLSMGTPAVVPLAEGQQPGFGSTVEITINDAVSVKSDSAIDFDTGRLFSLPDPDDWVKRTPEEVVQWLTETGLDASGASRDTVKGLMCEDMVFASMNNSYWDNVKPDSLAANDLWKGGYPLDASGYYM
ncbi:MAG: HEAT repeat domain-containing protein [Planctomycetes bacterium]|nr:HEAT repeat domain-containing protein [Planctomycetota bacterium]